MTDAPHSVPSDAGERARALDPQRSFIVQAPAGSGKTELLTQRLLVLLAGVEAPEEILAITFTRKAAGEMQGRLVEALEAAATETPPDSPHRRKSWELGRRVLECDRERGWRLLDNPSRLQIQTIDSLCASLARRMPWLSRCGEAPRINDQPAELYREAVDQLLLRLQQPGGEDSPLAVLLDRFDNRLSRLRDDLVAMLGRRDQWLRHLLERRGPEARRVLEAGLQGFVASRLHLVREALLESDADELRELLDFALENLGPDHPLNRLPRRWSDEPADAAALQGWLALSDLVLTGQGGVRSALTRNQGFPAGKDSVAVEMKRRMGSWLERARGGPLQLALGQLRSLPEPAYQDGEWQALEALIELLPLAASELEAIFRQRGEIDFIGLAGAARTALGSAESPEELLLALDRRIRHLLIDEFQDTSFGQYDLLLRLTAGWTAGDGRSLFLVGDPMQSIYRFREAEVGLFLRAREGHLGDLALEAVELKANFRSSGNLVAWFNKSFPALFAPVADEVTGGVPFAPADPVKPDGPRSVVTATAWCGRQDVAEAEAVVSLVGKALQEDDGGTVAVLVRSRSHLEEIVRALNRAGIPFQAQDIDPLGSRPVIRDLVALTRALLHPADRVAWLAVLRAPWCGITLADLLALCEGDATTPIWLLLRGGEEQGSLFSRFSPDGTRRLERLATILGDTMEKIGLLPLRRLIESTWLQLGGPAGLDDAALADARQFFYLLERVERGGDIVSFADLQQRIDKLYAAPDPAADGRLQLMTIHKAKGLEFDTVIIPGLGRSVKGQDRTLLRWQEHPDFELLLAPVPAADAGRVDPTYAAIGELLKQKDRYEMVRLLYVAATRARHKLHLLGHVEERSGGEFKPVSGSFLDLVWDAWQTEFSLVSPPDLGAKPGARVPMVLRRLPPDWQVPTLAVSLKLGHSAAFHASRRDQGAFARPGASLRREEGRIIGQVIHGWLERIAGDDLDHWQHRIPTLQGRLGMELQNGGIPGHRLQPAIERVVETLRTVLSSERGRWLLAPHPEGATELPLSGIVDGTLVHAVIDRTFLTPDGVRWVIDYKTGLPETGEPMEAFLARETERYRIQLSTYSRLIGQAGEGGAVRCALYFPQFDRWQEVTL